MDKLKLAEKLHQLADPNRVHQKVKDLQGRVERLQIRQRIQSFKDYLQSMRRKPTA